MLFFLLRGRTLTFSKQMPSFGSREAFVEKREWQIGNRLQPFRESSNLSRLLALLAIAWIGSPKPIPESTHGERNQKKRRIQAIIASRVSIERSDPTLTRSQVASPIRTVPKSIPANRPSNGNDPESSIWIVTACHVGLAPVSAASHHRNCAACECTSKCCNRSRKD